MVIEKIYTNKRWSLNLDFNPPLCFWISFTETYNMANRYIILYAINIDSDFWYIEENSTPENKKPNSVFLKNLINAP